MQLGHYLFILFFVFIAISGLTDDNKSLSSFFFAIAFLCGIFAAGMIAI